MKGMLRIFINFHGFHGFSLLELNNPEFIQIEEKKIEQKTKISKTKQQTKGNVCDIVLIKVEVHFVLVEDDFDIGDIF